MWQEGIKRLKKNKAAVVSFWFIIFICLVSLFAKGIAPFSFETQNIDRIFEKPWISEYILGTDSLGRDLLSRIIYGGRMSMAIAILTAIASLLIGGLYGAISGWVGGKLDAVMMRVVDIMYSIPALVAMILVQVLFQSFNTFEDPELRALVGTFLALTVYGWVSLARLVRGQVMQVKEMVYVEAARAMGSKPRHIVLRHIVPNILGPVIVMLTFQIPYNVLFESFLSFIGLGLQPPFSSWGVLCAEGWQSIKTHPHLILYPGLILSLTMLAFNWFGDGLRDAFDPQMKNRA